jgi:hypothetical protein
MAIKLRTLTEIENAAIAREVERARMILLASKGKRSTP